MRLRRSVAFALIAVAALSCKPTRWRASKRTPSTPSPAPTLAGTAPPATATTGVAFGPPSPPAMAPCTNRFGSRLTPPVFGRIDGTLSAIVPPSRRGCRSDERHLHLQLALLGDTYDVAVPLGDAPTGGDLFFKEIARPVPGGAWVEGWHPYASIDYVRLFAVRSTEFEPVAPDDVVRRVESELAVGRHVSVWATAYGPGGAHEVHRATGAERAEPHDGAIALDPDAPRSRILLFRFARQRF